MIVPAGPHGGDGEAVARSLGLDPTTVLDLSASLNPWAPPMAALLAKHADAAGRYPDPRGATEALAAAMGVDPGRLLLTNGGSEAITLVARELGGGVAAEPEFALHPRSADGPRWRSDPHNPSGRLAPSHEQADVWDEAFYPLATGCWTAGRDAVVVGSLTKVWACPGLRLGYVLADDVDRFARHQPHWAVSTLAVAVVEDALAATHLDVWAAALAEHRAALVALLADHDLTAEAADAPWVLVRAPGLRERLAPQGVVVRDCASFDLPDHARIAVPGPDGLARLADALERTAGAPATWPRPVPLIGDTTSAAQRAAQADGWRLADDERAGLYAAVHRRRDVRRYRADEVPADVLGRVLAAGHAAPSVGHSQPWRFVLVEDPATRDRAALLADHERLVQADALAPEAARHLLDLQLEGIREAPLGIVVCCDRRTPAAGVLGRRTFPDADLWSCACAIQNLWLAARAEGLGVGWVTLFEPADLSALVDLPAGVEPLGWLCVGWPDERNPDPGLERAGWSTRLALDDVVLHERWHEGGEPAPPVSKLRGPDQAAVVGARDQADGLLTPLGSLGVLDRAADRVLALGHADLTGGTLVLAVGRHRVLELGVSAFDASVTDVVLDAARAGRALGVVAAAHAGLAVEVVDAGTATGNLRDEDALTAAAAAELVARGDVLGRALGERGLVALGEVGMGNTTVAAALAAALLGLEPDAVVGLGAGADTAMLDRKRAVVAAALERTRAVHDDPLALLAALGGPEVALLTGVTLGAAARGAPVVLDGLATSVAALVAVHVQPAVAAHLVAGQRSREPGHGPVLVELGLEPLLDLRLRAGEGVGACLASSLLLHALHIRAAGARTD